MFIKMGLGGTGYQGKPGSHMRAAQKRAAARKVLPGFPIDRPFESINEVREYLSGDKITFFTDEEVDYIGYIPKLAKTFNGLAVYQCLHLIFRYRFYQICFHRSRTNRIDSNVIISHLHLR